jgi:hypothetical protein
LKAPSHQKLLNLFVDAVRKFDEFDFHRKFPIPLSEYEGTAYDQFKLELIKYLEDPEPDPIIEGRCVKLFSLAEVLNQRRKPGKRASIWNKIRTTFGGGEKRVTEFQSQLQLAQGVLEAKSSQELDAIKFSSEPANP